MSYSSDYVPHEKSTQQAVAQTREVQNLKSQFRNESLHGGCDLYTATNHTLKFCLFFTGEPILFFPSHRLNGRASAVRLLKHWVYGRILIGNSNLKFRTFLVRAVQRTDFRNSMCCCQVETPSCCAGREQWNSLPTTDPNLSQAKDTHRWDRKPSWRSEYSAGKRHTIQDHVRRPLPTAAELVTFNSCGCFFTVLTLELRSLKSLYLRALRRHGYQGGTCRGLLTAA